jgi:hypothetical protein
MSVHWRKVAALLRPQAGGLPHAEQADELAPALSVASSSSSLAVTSIRGSSGLPGTVSCATA